MILILLLGAAIGTALVVGALAWRPPAPSLVTRLARLDPLPLDDVPANRGGTLARVSRLRPSAADLALLGRSREWFTTTRTIAAAVLAIVVGGCVSVAQFAGVPIPAVGALAALAVGATAGYLLPAVTLPSQIETRRREYRDAFASYLYLVSLGISAGRGTAEALSVAAAVSRWPLFTQIADALDDARLSARPPASALGQLGRDIDLPELRELAATLTLVADEGSHARDTLAARAAGLRRRQLSDAEGRAGANTETMLVAQFVIFIGFLLFLLLPAIAAVLVLNPSA